jgi:hypothetical protein
LIAVLDRGQVDATASRRHDHVDDGARCTEKATGRGPARYLDPPRGRREGSPSAGPKRDEQKSVIDRERDEQKSVIDHERDEQKSVIDGGGTRADGPSTGHPWPVTGPGDREHRR